MSNRQLEPIRLQEAFKRCEGPHTHVRLTRLNDHEVTIVVNEVAYPWHHHPGSDELLLVLEGSLKVRLGDEREVELEPGEAFLVPAGTTHMTRPRGRTVNLIIRRWDAETVFAGDESG